MGWVEGDRPVSTDTIHTFNAANSRVLTAKFEKVYTVAVRPPGSGTAAADKTTAAEGEIVTLTAAVVHLAGAVTATGVDDSGPDSRDYARRHGGGKRLGDCQRDF